MLKQSRMRVAHTAFGCAGDAGRTLFLSDTEQAPHFWVGIGASAGGLEALRAFVRNVPRNLNATYIIAQHLSPHHRSMLPEILGRETDFEVLSVEDSVLPVADKVYITPQNQDIVVDGDKLRLTPPSQASGAPKPSVDRLLRSLASQKGNRAVGIILSGTGSDGSEGVRAVKEEGGVTIAQDDMSAKYPDMPRAAVESGCVDLIMSPEEIGAQFAVILEKRANLEPLKSSPVHLDSVSELIHLVHTQSRVNFHHYKAATLQRRIERRMAAVGVTDIEDYVAIARTTPSEVDALFRDFLISVTSFFRDPAEFEALREYVNSFARAKPRTEPIRVWVPAVATGEEVYSLAMMVAEALGGIDELAERRVQFFASDLDAAAIEIARKGFYPVSALDAIPSDYIDRFMDKVPTGYLVKKSIRERVVFSVHNVVQDPPFLNIDFISCRNLLIYFQPALQAQAISRFHYALVPNGLLFLGKSETTAANDGLFRAVDEQRHIYIQRPEAENRALTNRRPTGMAPTRGVKKDDMVDGQVARVAASRFDSMVAKFGPDGVLVDEDLKILKTYGNINPYIEITSGLANFKASSLFKEPFGQDIRTSVPIAVRKNETRQGVAHADSEDPSRKTRVLVYPLDSGPNEPLVVLILFSSWQENIVELTNVSTDDDTSELVKQIEELRNELTIAQSNLQQTSEELETSNEELQALNEELQSSNEELQSTNEELETSNEELQSSNEELSTVNEELQVNSGELRIVNESIRSILLNIGSPLIVVDNSLNILYVSKATEKLFDIDKSLDLPHLSMLTKRAGFPNLVDLTRAAIKNRKSNEIEVVADGTNAIVSIVPHTTERGNLDGAILLIHDNTKELIERNRQFELAGKMSGVGYWNMDLKENTVFWSDQIYRIHGVDPADYTPDFDTAIAYYHPEDLEMVQTQVNTAITQGGDFEFEARLLQEEGDERIVRSIGQANVDAKGKTTSVFGVFVDITEDRQSAQKLQTLLDDLSKSNQELNRFSYVCSHDMKEPVRLIEAMCELVLDKTIGIEDTERDEIIGRIGTNASRLSEIIDGLLAYSRIDEKIDETEVDLNQTVAQIQESLALNIEESGAQLTVGKLPMVSGAPIHFLQLLQNLVANAIKFSNAETPEIHISGKTLKDEVRLFVEDNGPGIPQAAREEIFAVFKRLQRRDEVEGTGLGLSICQRIVAQYHGSISVETSRKLDGAKFVISLPRRTGAP